MPRRKTIFTAGQYYHVYNRGVNGELIFREEDNYFYLLKLVTTALEKYSVSLIVYCLMPNHYHFLLRQDGDEPISTFMQLIFNAYTKAFNKRYDRSGTLFEDRFKSVHVDSEAYLIYLCSYIHRNPIDTNPPLVTKIEDWLFSNYPEWIGFRNGKLVDRSFIERIAAEGIDYPNFVLEAVPVKIRQRMDKYIL